jgi:hypothetical protein
MFNALCLAGRSKLLLLASKSTRAVSLELDPDTSAVDANPEIRCAWCRFAAGVRRVPDERYLAPLAVLQRQPARELALLFFLVSIALW